MLQTRSGRRPGNLSAHSSVDPHRWGARSATALWAVTNELPGLRSFYARTSDCWATFTEEGQPARVPLIVACRSDVAQKALAHVARNTDSDTRHVCA